jgi:hypothetical protein
MMPAVKQFWELWAVPTLQELGGADSGDRPF